ncbi:MAG TPA: hypothetical protein DEB17_05085 [Chlorobaculum sp.]|uniref:Uncharacterized protein n=1 Tax=Chlorobaculum tepidum (strain ATCC 49652 / DSM 12025 / NBRC 103806 / TLS) TaxID=194439 RepID=Q8KAX4_CHLTE|nr:hypothetical protein CT2027 [Chlorobaculum tepidum TLS]HBU23358.1 hypothetical protein [Chlorobaculum sp.]
MLRTSWIKKDMKKAEGLFSEVCFLKNKFVDFRPEQ